MPLPGLVPQPVAPRPEAAEAALKLARASLEALALRAGQVLAARVLGTTANGLTQLAIAGQTLTVKLTMPLPAGTKLQVQVQAGGPQGQPVLVAQPQPRAIAPQAMTAPPLPTSAPQVLLLPRAMAMPTPVSGSVASTGAQSPIPMPQASGPPSAAVLAPLPSAVPQAMPPTATPAATVPAAIAQAVPAPAATPSPVMPPNAPAPLVAAPLPVSTPATQPTTAAPRPQPSPGPALVASAPPASAGTATTNPPTPGHPPPPAAVSGSTASVAAAAATPAASPVISPPMAPPALSHPTAPPQPAMSQVPQPGAPAPQTASAPLNAAPASAGAPAAAADAAAPVAPAAPAAARATAPFPVAPAPRPPSGLAAQAVLNQATQAAARQDSVLPLLQNLAALQGQIAEMPRPVAEAAMRLLAGRINLDRGVPDAAALKQAVTRSGVFLEALSKAGLAPQGDAKAALLALRDTLGAWLGEEVAPVNPVTRRPPPPTRGAQPRGVRSEPPTLPENAAPREAGRVLLGQAEAALSRVRLLQLASLPLDAARAAAPGAVGTAEWNLELPMMLGHELALAPLQISRDGKGRRDRRERGWRVAFSLDFPALGEVGAQVSLLGESTNVVIWAEEAGTAAALEEMLPGLTPALMARGLEVGSVRVRRGRPAPAQRPSGQLMDSVR